MFQTLWLYATLITAVPETAALVEVRSGGDLASRITAELITSNIGGLGQAGADSASPGYVLDVQTRVNAFRAALNALYAPLNTDPAYDVHVSILIRSMAQADVLSTVQVSGRLLRSQLRAAAGLWRNGVEPETYSDESVRAMTRQIIDGIRSSIESIQKREVVDHVK